MRGAYGPVRRAAGMLGLIALAPTALGLVSGTITATEAAVRAAATMGVAVVVARIASWWIRNALERAGPTAPALPASGAGPPPGAGAADSSGRTTPRRRATDNPRTGG